MLHNRKPAITSEQLDQMDRLLADEGWDARALTWEQLGNAIGLEVTAQTLRKAMGTMAYHKCIACPRGWVSLKTRERRLKWAQYMLEKYPNSEDWKCVRFSDEVHFGWGSQEKVYIICKPGQRYCIDCLHEENQLKEKDQKRFHCWAAIGFDFKSPIHFYQTSNSNGKMSQDVYIYQILKPIVQPWLDREDSFALEEDGDSGHGPGFGNKVQKWKKQHGLEYYFNCPSSSDLSPIENCWLLPKQHLRKISHWDDETTKELIYEGWERVSQDFINERVLSMPQRLRDVIAAEGRMTGP